MTTFEAKVKSICREIYYHHFQQITIDLVQEQIEDLNDEKITRDGVSAAAYNVGILLEAINPKFERDVDLLARLYKALEDWSKDIEITNVILGTPKES